MRAPSPRRTVVIGVALLGAFGCTSPEIYLDDSLIAFAMTEDTPPFFDAGDEGALFVLERRVTFPIREPNAMELAALEAAAATSAPFARAPWVNRYDLSVEVTYTLSNLSDERTNVAVLVNGFNEFHEYMPAVTIDDEDEIIADFSGYELTHSLAAGERITRTIREEQIDEIAVDLATVVNGAPNANQVVYFENVSDRDVRARPFIPRVIPGLVGFRLGIRTTEARRIVIEATVRVRDRRARLAPRGTVPWMLPAPMLFVPTPLG